MDDRGLVGAVTPEQSEVPRAFHLAQEEILG
jgi:hypothetical protein